MRNALVLREANSQSFPYTAFTRIEFYIHVLSLVSLLYPIIIYYFRCSIFILFSKYYIIHNFSCDCVFCSLAVVKIDKRFQLDLYSVIL